MPVEKTSIGIHWLLLYTNTSPTNRVVRAVPSPPLVFAIASLAQVDVCISIRVVVILGVIRTCVRIALDTPVISTQNTGDSSQFRAAIPRQSAVSSAKLFTCWRSGTSITTNGTVIELDIAFDAWLPVELVEVDMVCCPAGDAIPSAVIVDGCPDFGGIVAGLVNNAER